MSGSCEESLATYAPVPGSPTALELAVGDGSVRKCRTRPWSSWGIRCEKQARVSPTPNGGARVCAHRHEETWPPDMRIAQDLSMSRVRKAGKSLTVRNPARFTRGLIWQDAVGARPSSRERTWPLSFLGCRIAPGPYICQSRGTQNGG